MNESDIIRLVRRVIRQELAPILLGSVVSNQDQNRTTIQHFATSSPIPKLRNIQPYGVASRAPPGTACLTIPIDGDPTHLNMVGHFDQSRPSMANGETILYDAFGHIVYLSDTKMQFGSKTSANPMMLGDIVQTLLSEMLELIADHVHPAPGYPPNNFEEFLDLKESPVDDGAIISDIAFTEKG